MEDENERKHWETGMDVRVVVDRGAQANVRLAPTRSAVGRLTTRFDRKRATASPLAATKAITTQLRCNSVAFGQD
jgi:hypothetical protein